MNRLIAVVFTAALATCMTTISQAEPESWGRQIFTSTKADKRACELGKESNKQNSNDDPNLGRFAVETPQGYASFRAHYSDYNFHCWMSGESESVAESLRYLTQKPPATMLFVRDQSVKTTKLKASVALERDSVLLRKLIPSSTEENLKYGQVLFKFFAFTSEDLSAIDRANSFTIVLSLGNIEKRFRITEKDIPRL
jgi:hypothetical protein